MNDYFSVCIGRQVGSGGRLIGEKLAGRLGIAFFDKELISIASKESGLGKSFFEQADEKSRPGLRGGWFFWPGSFGNEIYPENYLSNETLFQIQSDVIRDLASRQSCLFVGRCADYVLARYTRCVNIFICADREDRLKRIRERQELTENKAQELIDKMDKQRASYYNYFSGKVWGAADSYHLCINSSVLGIEGTVGLIRSFVEEKIRGRSSDTKN